MNIFVVDKDPVIAASMLCDQHLLKMCLETAQLLSTCHRIADGTLTYVLSKKKKKKFVKHWLHPNSTMEKNLYRVFSHNHPCNQWLQESTENYNWTFRHFVALLENFKIRYNKPHKSENLLPFLKSAPGNLIRYKLTGYRTPFKIAIKKEKYPELVKRFENSPYSDELVVDIYREYYILDKQFARWKHSRQPDWFVRNKGE